MVTNEPAGSKSSLPGPTRGPNAPSKPPSGHPSFDSVLNEAINYEKDGTEGLKEKLVGFKRFSGITLLILLSCVCWGFSLYFLVLVELSDLEWGNILKGEMRFRNLTPSPHRTKPYFETKLLADIPLGLMLKSRERWTLQGVDFGVGRDTDTFHHMVLIVVVFGFVVFGLIHLLFICTFKRCRRNFALISCAYGIVGLCMLLLFITTLHYGYVQKTSAYLENARVPPEIPAGGNDETKELFVNLTLACALAFSKPNPYAEYVYPINELPLDGSFTVQGNKYFKGDLMDLTLCPREDDLLIALAFVFVSGILGWLASSLSETLEAQLMGPPVWLQRFKVKIKKGVRHWNTRSALPSYLDLHRKLRQDRTSRNLTLSKMRTMVEKELERQEQYRSEDPYVILDGRLDHIQLNSTPIEVGGRWGSFSNARFYPSMANLGILTLTTMKSARNGDGDIT